jgi:4-carboxymuconolactone decarboxylase
VARVPRLRREDLDPEGQGAFDRIAAARGAVRDPFATLLHHPLVAERVAAVGELLRFHSVLDGADRELAILTAGREVEALFQWADHLEVALREGTRPAAIELVRERGSTERLLPREALIVETVRALFRDHRLSDEHYARAEAEFGRRALMELVALAGYYAMMGFFLNAFEIDLPEGSTPAFVTGPGSPAGENG